MASRAQWVAGARPRTLPAALAPVLVGTGAAAALDRADVVLVLLALIVALALQIGVNYANDYSDGIRGTDESRVGPVRLVGQRLAEPRHVKLMAFAFFGVGALAGLALVALANAVWLAVVGALAIVAAWRYTGGADPYGYRGFGEVYVFVFFGLVATLGTLYTQAGRLTVAGVLGAVAIGSLASAILVANNLRDIPTDTVNGKRTLAVRLGDTATRRLYLALLAVAYAAALVTGIAHPWALLALASLPLTVPLARRLRSGATGRELVPLIAGTGTLELAYAVLLTLGLWLTAG